MEAHPRRLVEEYVEKSKEILGVQPGQVWNSCDLNRKIAWGRHRGLQRMHYMLCELFVRLDAGRADESQALTVQCPKAVHQAQLDDGDWKMAWLLTNLRDPLQRTRFGGSERELEAIASFTRAMDDLEVRMKKERGKPHDEDGEAEPQQGRTPKGGGKNKDGQ